MRACTLCERQFPDAFFSTADKLPWGLSDYCNNCWKSQRSKAWTLYRVALKGGKVVKETTCERCHRTEPEITISGHHLNYNFPFLVVWLCQSCHGWVHRWEEKRVKRLRIEGNPAPFYTPENIDAGRWSYRSEIV